MFKSLRNHGQEVVLCSLVLAFPNCAAAQVNTNALCGNPLYCIYDSATYIAQGYSVTAAASEAETAFVSAVGSNQLGEDNFSEDPVGRPNPQLSPVGAEYVCDATGNCGTSHTSAPFIPNAGGNFLYGASVESGLYYVGFDYASEDCGLVSTSCPLFSILTANGPSLPAIINEPSSGFFGIVASSPIEEVVNLPNLFVDNVLWAGAAGQVVLPDVGCDNKGTTGVWCWLWIALFNPITGALVDPAGASAYTYSTLDGSNFTSVGGFPSGFAAPFDVSSGNTDFGLFASGQTLIFPGAGVPSFTISGITPTVDGSNDAAFPVEITLNNRVAEVQAIPSQLFVLPSQATVTASTLTYNSGAATATGTLTFTNVSSGSISGPFQILLTALPSGVTLANASGAYGSISYVSPPTNSLAQGQSVDLNLQFTNPANSVITFTPVVFAGTGSNGNPVSPQITFAPAPSSQTYGMPITAGSLDATAEYNGSPVGGTFVYTTGACSGGGQVLTAGATILQAGSYSITACFTPSSPDYAASSATAQYSVQPAAQSISFGSIAAQIVGASISLNATASSGLQVAFQSLTPAVCSVSQSTATMLSVGTCTIDATQSGGVDYNAATPVEVSFPVMGFTLTAKPASETVNRGILGVFLLEVKSVNGFSGNVSISCTGGPSDSVCGDFPQTVPLKANGTGVAVSGILFRPQDAKGTYTITFTGISGTDTSTAKAQFRVK